MNARRFTSALACAAALTLVPVAAPAANAASACVAKISVSNPRQYTNTTITVSKVRAGSNVTTTAAYKTTKTVKKAKANTKGVSSITYYISGATKGRKVPVSVRAQYGATVWTCSTSFTPR